MNTLIIDSDLKYLDFLVYKLKIFTGQIASFSNLDNLLKIKSIDSSERLGLFATLNEKLFKYSAFN